MLQGLNEVIALPVLAHRPKLTPGSREIAHVTGRSVMVTGAGGSIGSELVRQIAEAGPASLVLLDHSEYALYEVVQTLRENEVSFPLVPALVDVRDGVSVRSLFRENPVDTVLHAAAYKHVPMLETPANAIEGLRTNVLGTAQVLRGAARHGSHVVVVSTDKAVEPSSFMGVTKRLAELVCASSLDVDVSVVRFGNVLGSSGSVVPLFMRQIAQGYAVTVTHPDMTRFFMTIRQAVALVLQATALASRRPSVYVLQMGQPVRILDVARELIEQAGLRPDVDVPIKIVGMRPGEKLHERLSYGHEQMEPSPVDGIDAAPLVVTDAVRLEVDALLDAIGDRDLSDVRQGIRLLVPEYGGQDPWWR